MTGDSNDQATPKIGVGIGDGIDVGVKGIIGVGVDVSSVDARNSAGVWVGNGVGVGDGISAELDMAKKFGSFAAVCA
jgi:hypothetical protein